jgi:glutamate---cysteine ligase / carboxylate-amine ligase
VEHSFGTSADFTVGIEEELLVVDKTSHDLAHASEPLLAAMHIDKRLARHDLYEAQIELSSPISRNAEEATRSLGELRGRLRDAGGTVIGAGIHPAGRFGDVRIVDAERYARESERLRGLVDRTPDCALHVHVGMPDPETAILVCNGFREQIPLLEALAGNSPFWFGRDSGFASARRFLRRGFPRVQIPAPFGSFAEYEDVVNAAVNAAEVDDYTFLWWEVRPHPKFGTVEVRTMDSQSSLGSVAGLAALVQGLAKHFAESPRGEPAPREVVAEASFRAGRDGVDATLPVGDSLRPVRQVAADVLALVRPHARELGSEAPLEEIERIVRDGNGAYRQRAAHGNGGMPAVLRRLVDETADRQAW